MTHYTVYGIRDLGEVNPRYIGQTRRTLDARLIGHLRASRLMPKKTAMAAWLLDHEDTIEIYRIADAETLTEAKRIERDAIGRHAGCGLYNVHHVDPMFRLVQRPAEAA